MRDAPGFSQRIPGSRVRARASRRAAHPMNYRADLEGSSVANATLHFLGACVRADGCDRRDERLPRTSKKHRDRLS